MPDPKNEKERCILVTKVDPEEVKKMENDRDQLEFEDLEAAVGFSKVIRRISESQKTVVGHNMLLDVCYTLQQFVAPLPEDYDEFKHLVKASLPKIFGKYHSQGCAKSM